MTADRGARGATPTGPTSAYWAAVVEADALFIETLRAIPAGELPGSIAWALGDFASQPTELRVLSAADPSLTSSVLPALEPLLLVSHSSLTQCRGLVLRLPRQECLGFLAGLTERVVSAAESDDEAYRRLAELLRDACATKALQVLTGAASGSDNAEVREVADDFSGSASG